MPVGYRDLLNDVRRAVGLSSVDEARASINSVLSALEYRLGDADRDRLWAVLPTELRPRIATGVGEPVERTETPGVAGFLMDVARRCDCSEADARLRARVVLTYLAEEEPELFRPLALPGGVAELLDKG